MLTLLVIDDDMVDRRMVSRLLQGKYRVLEACGSESALAQLDQETPNCVLLDYELAGENAFQLIPLFVEKGFPVIVYSGRGDETIAAMTYRFGGSDYLIKGRLNEDILHHAIDKAVRKSRLRPSRLKPSGSRSGASDTPFEIEPAIAPEETSGPLRVNLQTEFDYLVHQAAHSHAIQEEEWLERSCGQIVDRLIELRAGSQELQQLAYNYAEDRRMEPDKVEFQVCLDACHAVSMEISMQLLDNYRHQTQPPLPVNTTPMRSPHRIGDDRPRSFAAV